MINMGLFLILMSCATYITYKIASKGFSSFNIFQFSLSNDRIFPKFGIKRLGNPKNNNHGLDNPYVAESNEKGDGNEIYNIYNSSIRFSSSPNSEFNFNEESYDGKKETKQHEYYNKGNRNGNLIENERMSNSPSENNSTENELDEISDSEDGLERNLSEVTELGTTDRNQKFIEGNNGQNGAVYNSRSSRKIRGFMKGALLQGKRFKSLKRVKSLNNENLGSSLNTEGLEEGKIDSSMETSGEIPFVNTANNIDKGFDILKEENAYGTAFDSKFGTIKAPYGMPKYQMRGINYQANLIKQIAEERGIQLSKEDIEKISRIATYKMLANEEKEKNVLYQTALREMFQTTIIGERKDSFVNAVESSSLSILSESELNEVKEEAKRIVNNLEGLSESEKEERYNTEVERIKTERIDNAIIRQIIANPDGYEAQTILGTEGLTNLEEHVKKEWFKKEISKNAEFISEHSEYKGKALSDVEDSRKLFEMKNTIGESISEAIETGTIIKSGPNDKTGAGLKALITEIENASENGSVNANGINNEGEIETPEPVIINGNDDTSSVGSMSQSELAKRFGFGSKSNGENPIPTDNGNLPQSNVVVQNEIKKFLDGEGENGENEEETGTQEEPTNNTAHKRLAEEGTEKEKQYKSFLREMLNTSTIRERRDNFVKINGSRYLSKTELEEVKKEARKIVDNVKGLSESEKEIRYNREVERITSEKIDDAIINQIINNPDGAIARAILDKDSIIKLKENNIKEIKGIQGETGEQGKPGRQGTAGSKGKTGSTVVIKDKKNNKPKSLSHAELERIYGNKGTDTANTSPSINGIIPSYLPRNNPSLSEEDVWNIEEKINKIEGSNSEGNNTGDV